MMRTMQVVIDVSGFAQEFAWDERRAHVTSRRLCSGCSNELDLSKGGGYFDESGCFIICGACGGAHFYDDHLENNYWDKVWAVEVALTRAVMNTSHLSEQDARRIAEHVRDATQHHSSQWD